METTLDKNLFTVAVLMELSKVFDFFSHDLLIAKFHAYDFDMVTLLNSYLKDRKQDL